MQRKPDTHIDEMVIVYDILLISLYVMEATDFQLYKRLKNTSSKTQFRITLKHNELKPVWIKFGQLGRAERLTKSIIWLSAMSNLTLTAIVFTFWGIIFVL